VSFGIVSVDGARARFKGMRCDFYGRVVISPNTVELNRPELDLARCGSRVMLRKEGIDCACGKSPRLLE